MKPVLLIVDDDEDIRTQLKWSLDEHYTVHLAQDRASAVQAMQKQPSQVVLLDLGLPPHPAAPTEGLATLSELLALNPAAKVIVVTGQSEKTNALQAIGNGAYDFLAKPVEITELKIILGRAFHVAQLEKEYRHLKNQTRPESFEGMLGTSPQMMEVFTRIRKVAGTEAPVLLLGESGTGKEMVARAIHATSPRKDGPFVAINCGAIPETLLESELFGHEKGAFTGAHVQRKGRIETAGGGTLFLDEIGELSLALQVKLLRFLQDQCIQRVGGREEIEVNVRVVAATNSDLKKALTEQKFREDLYYRLAVVTLQLPALRERQGDIGFLAQSFLHRFAQESGKESLKFSVKALRAMEQHSWPGNIRELENRVRRAAIMVDGGLIGPEDLELQVVDGPGGKRTLKEAREAVERQMVTDVLRRHGGSISAAAEELGISRPTLYELIEKLKINRN